MTHKQVTSDPVGKESDITNAHNEAQAIHERCWAHFAPIRNVVSLGQLIAEAPEVEEGIGIDHSRVINTDGQNARLCLG